MDLKFGLEVIGGDYCKMELCGSGFLLRFRYNWDNKRRIFMMN